MERNTTSFRILKSICFGYIAILIILIVLLSGRIINNIDKYSNNQNVDVAINYDIYTGDAITN